MNAYILITGASGGLGKSLAKKLKAKGLSLALVSRRKEKISLLAQELNALAIEADISTPEGAEASLSACIARFGNPPSGLALCAGNTLIAPLHRTKPEQFRDCLSANLDTAYYTLQAYINQCLENDQPGSAVLVSSVVARIGVVNHEAIAACKGAIEALTRSAAATYAPKGIRVNAIAPGLMRSPLTERLFTSNSGKAIAAQYPLGRYGLTEDGAGAICWLLSDESNWVTGQIISVDGGFSSIRPLIRA
ncbi:MAG: SDR family oxidoreductase [Proteobacteria bacterium]|nr:SDR family oxidoreductase [Pseudomonadota bacterium]